MKFMVTWNIPPTQMAPAVARFLETGGAPPKGVKMLGRWHGAGLGFALADCKDGKALYEWMAEWSDQPHGGTPGGGGSRGSSCPETSL